MAWTLTKKRMDRLENAFNIAAWSVANERGGDMEMFRQGAMFAMRYVHDIVENGSDMELYDLDKMEKALVARYDELVGETGRGEEMSAKERLEAYLNEQ